jgi:hypothetical protein
MLLASEQQAPNPEHRNPSFASPSGSDVRPAKSPTPRLADIQLRIRRYNSDIDIGSETFRAAVLLLLASESGQNIDMLARRTGFDRPFVARCARRLIDNGVWQGGLTVAEWTAGDEASGSFWNDVAVAMGKLCRRIGADGLTEWAPAGFWNKSYGFGESDDDEQPQVATYHDPGTVTEHPVPLRAEIEPVEKAVMQDAQAPTRPPAASTPAPRPETTHRPTGVGGGSLVPIDQAPPSVHPGTEHRLPSLDELFADAVWLG